MLDGCARLSLDELEIKHNAADLNLRFEMPA